MTGRETSPPLFHCSEVRALGENDWRDERGRLHYRGRARLIGFGINASGGDCR